MEKSTVVTLLIVAGLGGLVLWWYMRTPGTAPAVQTVPDNCTGLFGGIGSFIKGHVDRKNALAPVIASKYTGAPASALKGVTDLAGKLSPSGYVEAKIGNAVGNFFCDLKLPSLSSVGNALKNAGSFAVESGVKGVTTVGKTSTTFGASQLKAGTVGPVKSLYSAGDNLVHGNFGDAAKDIGHSIVDGPKSAVTSTYNAIKSLNPF